MVNGLSSLGGGMIGGIFPFFDRLFDRIGFRNSAALRDRPSRDVP